MEIKKLVVLDKNDFNEQQKQELKSLSKEVIIYDNMPKDDDEAIKRMDGADAVIVCWYGLSKKCIDSCPNLKYLGVVATGYGWLAAEYASEKGIIVTNIPGYATKAVSSFIFKQLENFDIKNKTFGVIGLGRIGQRVGEIGKSKGLNIIYWNRTTKETEFKKEEFDEIFKKADVIVLQVSYNEGTKGIIKNKNLDDLKEEAIIVNVVSPKLFDDENYLIKIIDNKNLKLILDFEEKSRLEELKGENVIYTKGIAWKSDESIFNLHQITIKNLKSYINGKTKNNLK